MQGGAGASGQSNPIMTFLPVILIITVIVIVVVTSINKKKKKEKEAQNNFIKIRTDIKNDKPSQSEEKELLISDDKTIVLTTHKIIQRSDVIYNEIFLKDIISYGVTKKISNYLLGFTIAFGAIFLLYLFVTLRNQAQYGMLINQSRYYDPAYSYCFELFLIFLFPTIGLIFHRREFFKINGRLGSIEFPIKNLGKLNLNKFISAIEENRNN